MTPADLTAAREALGLKASELGRALELTGRDPGRTVLLWEAGKTPIPGPARVAVRYMLAEAGVMSLRAFVPPEPQAPEKPQEDPEPPAAVTLAADPVPPVLEPSQAPSVNFSARPTRRRG